MPYRILLSLFCLLIFSSTRLQASDPVKIRKVVIDAGHGGYDPGAISPDGRIREKDLTLSVALKLGKLIEENCQGIKVIYTRSTDVFIPLNTRTEIANKNQADLFISIHINSAKARSASGSETFVMGDAKSSSNLEVTMTENSVIALEGDHQSVYEGFDPNNPESYIIFSLLQNAHLEQSLLMAQYVQEQLAKGPVKINRGIKQGGLLVLWKTSMPAILVELGFISNSSDLSVLVGDANHEKYAKSLFLAFERFLASYESGKKIEAKPIDTAYVMKDTLAVTKKDVQPVTINGPGNVAKSQPQSVTLNKGQDTIKSNTRTRNAEKEIREALQKQEKQARPFRIQILAVTKELPDNAPDFRGEKNLKFIIVGNFYKYSVGEFETKEEAQKELAKIKKKFPQAFIIKVENENQVK